MQFFRHLQDFVRKLRNLRSAQAVILGMVFLLSACATAPGGHSAGSYAGKSLEDQVRERATKRWLALIAGDLDSAYSYFSPATKATYPIELYRVKMRPGIWREAKVDTVKCADSVCEAVVVLTIDHSRIKGVITPVTERWLIQDGLAWYVYNG